MSLRLNLSEKNTKNMTVLKSLDAEINEVIADATHISIYEFDAITTSWKRFGVEGTAFIVTRTSNPRFKLIVLNKQGLDNFYLDLSTVHKMKIQTPYIMLKCSTEKAPAIYGLWFHDDDERSIIYDEIQKITTENHSVQKKTVILETQPKKSSSVTLLETLKKKTDKTGISSAENEHNKERQFILLSPSDFTGKIRSFRKI